MPNGGLKTLLYTLLTSYCFRLTPAYGLIMLVLSTLLLHLGSGPLWNFMYVESQKCQESWWTNILYINNFVNLDS